MTLRMSLELHTIPLVVATLHKNGAVVRFLDFTPGYFCHIQAIFHNPDVIFCLGTSSAFNSSAAGGNHRSAKSRDMCVTAHGPLVYECVYLYDFFQLNNVGMSLALSEQGNLVGAVDPPGDDLDGVLEAGRPADATPANAEAPVAEQTLAKVDVVLAEKCRVLKKINIKGHHYGPCCSRLRLNSYECDLFLLNGNLSNISWVVIEMPPVARVL